MSWIVAAYLITSTISTPIYGKLSDIYGRRRVLITCIAIFIATSTLCGVAQSLNQLILFRALQGLGGGGLMAMTQSAIADVVAPRERGRYQGYISAVWAITAVSGPIVGGFLVQTFSWRWIFWINLPVGATAMWACHNALRRLSPPVLSAKPKLDIVGMLLLSGAITVLLLALGWGGSAYAWLSPEILGLVGGGLCLLLLLVVQELRVHDPLLPPRVFKSPSYVASITVSTLASLLMFICLFTIPLYFQLARGSTAEQSGLYLVPFMLASAAGNVTGSRWARHFGTLRAALRIATTLAFTGLMLLALLPHAAPVWAIIAGMIIAGFGVGNCFIGSMTSAQNALIARDIGSGTSALLVLRAVGGASGSTLAGAIIAAGLITAKHTAGNTTSSPTFGTVYAIAATIAAIIFVVTLLMPNTRLRETMHAAAVAE